MHLKCINEMSEKILNLNFNMLKLRNNDSCKFYYYYFIITTNK